MQMPQLLTRPSLWGMAYSVMLALALYALWAIPTEVLPRFDYPRISIIAHDPGASAGEMETLIVRPLEGKLLGLQDLVSLRSSMGLGSAELTVGFRAGTDPQVALQVAYGAVDRARGSLPPGVSPYAEIMGSAINEVADYSVLIPAGVSPAVVQRAIRTRVLPALRALPGVQRIELFCALRAGHESGAPRLPARLPNPDPFDRHPPSVLHAARIHQCGQSPEAPQGAECAPAGLTSAHPGAGLLAAAVLPAAA
jgi:multidrug efflux pump subunit AcrB